MVKRLVTVIGIAYLWFALGFSTYAQGNEISQISVKMPEVKVYLNQSIEGNEEIRAFLSEKELFYQNVESVEKEDIAYYILLDCSGSIPREDFYAYKESITELSENIRENDALLVYTFGDDTVKLYNSREQNLDELSAVLETIENRNQNTLLFDSIKNVANEASKEDFCDRKSIILLTDGEDFSLGTTTGKEALEYVQETGIPVYAITMENSKKEYIDAIGEFCRKTGGNGSVVENKKYDEALLLLSDQILNSSCIYFKAENNKITNKKETLTLNLNNQNEIIRKDVYVNKWIPDTDAPYIKDVKKIQEETLLITFSEPVKNADSVASWKVTWNDENISIKSVNYCDTDEAIELNFDQNLYTGSYTIAGIGITDISQEENELDSSYQFNIEGEEQLEESLGEKQQYNLYILVSAVFGVGIICVIFLGIIFVKKKKKETSNLENPMTEVSAVKISEYDQRIKVEIQESLGKDIAILVNFNGNVVKKINTKIDKELIVGRDPKCNLSFDIKTLSKRHFKIEYDGKYMYIDDLGSTNGTKVNGILIERRHRLERKDVISAGMLRFQIEW